jgi:hypothetical protein
MGTSISGAFKGGAPTAHVDLVAFVPSATPSPAAALTVRAPVRTSSAIVPRVRAFVSRWMTAAPVAPMTRLSPAVTRWRALFRQQTPPNAPVGGTRGANVPSSGFGRVTSVAQTTPSPVNVFDTALAVAMTTERKQAFGQLSPEQWVLADRAMTRALTGLTTGPYGGPPLSVAEFNEAVGLILEAAQSVHREPLAKGAKPSAPLVAAVPLGEPAKPQVLPPLAVPNEMLAPRGPEGVISEPPPRPTDYNISQVSRDQAVDALNTLESNSYPVSSPQYEHPADPLFANWYKACGRLGSRSLTMAEMNSLISSGLGWRSGTETHGERDAFELKVGSTGLASPHELHFFAGGFRDLPKGAASLGIRTAGLGGEAGLFARVTDEFDTGTPDDWGKESEIEKFWFRKVHSGAGEATPEATARRWKNTQLKLETASRAELLVKIDDFGKAGYLADPRERGYLSPLLQQLKDSPPNSPTRYRAAKAVVENLQQRSKLTETVSVSGATAEVQVLETVYQYLKENRLEVGRPDQKIDVVAVYKLYRELLSRGELTPRKTVQAWLMHWKLPWVP